MFYRNFLSLNVLKGRKQTKKNRTALADNIKRGTLHNVVRVSCPQLRHTNYKPMNKRRNNEMKLKFENCGTLKNCCTAKKMVL